MQKRIHWGIMDSVIFTLKGRIEMDIESKDITFDNCEIQKAPEWDPESATIPVTGKTPRRHWAIVIPLCVLIAVLPISVFIFVLLKVQPDTEGLQGFVNQSSSYEELSAQKNTAF